MFFRKTSSAIMLSKVVYKDRKNADPSPDLRLCQPLEQLRIYQEVPANDSRGIYCSHHHTVGIYLLFYLLPYCGSQDRLFRLRPAKQLLFPYKSPFRRSAALQLFFTGSELISYNLLGIYLEVSSFLVRSE